MRQPYLKTPQKTTVFCRFDKWRAGRITGKPWTPARSLAVDRIILRMDAAGWPGYQVRRRGDE